MTNDLPRRMREAADTLAEAVARRHGAPNSEIVEWSPEALRKVAEQFEAEDERCLDVGTLRGLFVNKLADYSLGDPGNRYNCADSLARLVVDRLERHLAHPGRTPGPAKPPQTSPDD